MKDCQHLGFFIKKKKEEEYAAYVLFIISSQLTLLSFQHVGNVNRCFLEESCP